MTRIGLVGVGHWGQHILRDLRALGCDVTALARSSASVARAKAQGAVRICPAIDTLGEQDGFVVASPTVLHAAHIRSLLPQGKPIFVEKPVTWSSADVRTLGPNADRLVYCMDKWRYHPGVLWLADCARSGRLGALQGISLIRVGGVSTSSSVTSAWHLAPHDLAITLEVFGFIPEVRAATAAVLGDWAYGCHVILGTSPWATIEFSERRGKHYREVRLVCAEGEATLSGSYADAIVVRRHTRGAVGEKVLLPIDTTMPLRAELSAFVDFVRGSGPAPKSSLADAALVVRRIEEIHEHAGVSPHALAVP